MKWTAVLTMLMMMWAPAFPQVEYSGLYYPENEEVSHLIKAANFNRVSFELVKGMMLVKAEIEGRRGNFILDTGAPSLIVNGENLQGRSEQWANISGEHEAQAIRVKQFNWAGIQKNGIEAISLDISHLEETYQRELLGVIGYEVFSDREIYIDARNMQIIIFKGKDNPLSRVGAPLATLSFQMQSHLPVIETQIDGHSYFFGFDSGCSANLIEKKVLDRLPEDHYHLLAYQELQGFSQEVRHVPLIQTSSVQIENLPAVEMNFLAVDFSHLNGTELQIDGLLGYPFFKNLTFSINYAKRQLRIWKIHPGLAEEIP